MSGIIISNTQVGSKFVCVNGLCFVLDSPSNEVIPSLVFSVLDTLQAGQRVGGG